MSPRFRLFKKKDDVGEVKRDIDSSGELHETANSLTVSETLTLLQQIESEKLNRLTSNLSPFKESVVKCLTSVERIANKLEAEDIKLEETSFKSIVENSKRTIAFSLRREASSDLPPLHSIHEVKKFEGRLESIIDRFGEVSGSHSRVMNVFMKRYAGKLKGEFETLSSLLKEVKSLISEFEEENSVIVNCKNLLGLLSQNITSTKDQENKFQNAHREIEIVKYDIDTLKNQLYDLENSTQFKESYRNLEEIDAVEKEEQELHRNILDLYNHVSRAFTKYSYGMTKDTQGRLRLLIEQPWKIFDDAEGSSYTLLLIEVQKAVISGKIKLKDSEKTIHYMEMILKSLPEYQQKIRRVKHKLNVLCEKKNGATVNKSKELKDNITNCNNRLADLEHSLDRLKNQITQNKSERESLIKQIEDHIFQITGKKYSIKGNNNCNPLIS